jgi:hypothetical protein
MSKPASQISGTYLGKIDAQTGTGNTALIKMEPGVEAGFEHRLYRFSYIAGFGCQKEACLLHHVVHGTHCGCCSGKTELLDRRMRSRVITRGKNQDLGTTGVSLCTDVPGSGENPLGNYATRYVLSQI